uniref:Uncharacterized protein n=1 Tax=Octopus bimaculoides TaxID=37653 RepID=A0A0L8GBW5_OCTBM
MSAEEPNEAIDVNKDLILPSPPTGLTKRQFENWLPVDDGAIVAPEIITEEEKLDEIIHEFGNLRRKLKEMKMVMLTLMLMKEFRGFQHQLK